MKLRKVLYAGAFFGLSASSLFAQTQNSGTPSSGPNGIIGSNVAVCDPNNPLNCLAIGSNGSPANPSTVVVSGAASAIHDCGGSIIAGGTAQLAISSAQYIHGFLLEVGVNDSNTDPIYFSDTTTTPGAGVAGSFSINPSTATAAGGSFSTPLNYPVGSNIYVNGATTGDKFKCRYW